ncbi:MAG: hypothetical protein RR791_03525 [Lachnospiraceae bacterium]
MSSNQDLPGFKGSAYERTSGKIAKERLQAMHHKDHSEEPKVTYNPDVINECNPDNNLYWEKNHNILSSKGD